eukprot:TRINITY_DN41_c1_g2_i1.p1 TRINITY_DN41_c1_g2~~TRINITY_DN41_c1_g2_i1.p1  ORF type:complete len:194 (+),score=41.50 TRINITY_DN41_c1_g2_i1:60-584(+)
MGVQAIAEVEKKPLSSKSCSSYGSDVSAEELAVRDDGLLRAALAMIVFGYTLIWVGIFVVVAGEGRSIMATFAMEAVGIVSCVTGCVVVCLNLSPRNKALCFRVMLGTTVMNIVFFSTLVFLLFDTSSTDDWGSYNNTILTIYAAAVLGVSCCVKLSILKTLKDAASVQQQEIC